MTRAFCFAGSVNCRTMHGVIQVVSLIRSLPLAVLTQARRTGGANAKTEAFVEVCKKEVEGNYRRTPIASALESYRREHSSHLDPSCSLFLNQTNNLSHKRRFH